MNELSKNDVDSLKSYLVVCVKCLSSLIEKLFYFNHANDLIELIVQQLTNKTTEISKLAIESVKKLYKDDKDLQLSLDVIAFYNYKLTVNIDIYYFKIER
jgi:hypothetical protein